MSTTTTPEIPTADPAEPEIPAENTGADAADTLPTDETEIAEEFTGEQPSATSSEPDWAAQTARFRDLALRTQADFDNYRKRIAREKEESIRYGTLSLLEEILPILDNFELGLQAARLPNADVKTLLFGLDMVSKQFAGFLENSGVQSIVVESGKFDPARQEALAQEHSESVPENHVVRTIRKGYKCGDRLLRAANVVVSKGPAPVEAPDEEAVETE